MSKKSILMIVIASLLSLVIIPLIQAQKLHQTGFMQQETYHLSTDSNFFGQPEDQTLVPIDPTPQLTVLDKGFTFVGETDQLQLYIKERYFQIAVIDRQTGYIWYSVYPDYLQMGLSGTSRFFIESGVIIEYYNMDNILVEDSKSYVSGPKYNVDVAYDYTAVEKGFKAHLTFNDLAIEFDVIVSINQDQLKVLLPHDSIEEGVIEKEVLNLDGTTSIKATTYRLKSVFVFPYFGTNNYEINGYAMIPDGSGALIRYTDNRSATAYTKRLYGTDEGLTTFKVEDASYYLQDELTASYPTYGINHGYHQAAFLAVMTQGDAYAEIHSYPYGYNSYYINTTFFKFIIRERYTIQTSSNAGDSFQLINTDPYPTDYQVTYYFLQNDEASYSGMASHYRDVLQLSTKNVNQPSLQMTVLGMDYKPGLFGKNYVAMTTYDNVKTMMDQLKLYDIDHLDLVYSGWNKGGYYDNENAKPVVASQLGGRNDFLALMDAIESSDAAISFHLNPLIAYQAQLGSGVIKKITLSNFATDAIKSSLFAQTYYTNPSAIAEKILDYEDRYSDLNIQSLMLSTVGNALFSYRYQSDNIDRQSMIELVQSQLALLQSYNLGLVQPNSYLWSQTDRYYQAPIESNKYAYITDSIPFISLVLSGTTHLFSPYVNYVSDYDLMSLRLMEYGITPSFLLTYESTHRLRYTNSEYIYTSEFALWFDVMVKMGLTMKEANESVQGSTMISHRYLDYGIAEVGYANGVKMVFNYTDSAYTIDANHVVESQSYKAVMPS